ncbi:hypothetical protein ACWD4J_41285 [Streptomyces sp. NPDC002577]
MGLGLATTVAGGIYVVTIALPALVSAYARDLDRRREARRSLVLLVPGRQAQDAASASSSWCTSLPEGGAGCALEVGASSEVDGAFDGRRPSAELLARQLAASAVPVRTYQAAGMPHRHLNRTPALAEVDGSLGFFADALR